MPDSTVRWLINSTHHSLNFSEVPSYIFRIGIEQLSCLIIKIVVYYLYFSNALNTKHIFIYHIRLVRMEVFCHPHSLTIYVRNLKIYGIIGINLNLLRNILHRIELP